MSSENIVTVTKMLESLPETAQTQLIEHLREYIASLQNELEWDNLVSKTQNNLIKAAKQAKQEIAEGKSQPMNYQKLFFEIKQSREKFSLK
jgi:hypothetical protein